ncbi:hypothetical protein COW81_01375 [Candidatus Campbellbacteria bacterium CG22_combo_CG10-13_8_21_14_all_36_13]|uniref:Metallo-beta-lactamase domain-containing protein n=1 Tax=Candidatus Campbellbacteria bacterium CG22_combo_CG10-13_8_21_14_all_36_13 TaxID=1974529 RepID=A0A2H0DZ10_9BACT|nr:MAG: hypothetical protein COW81_01375 [Candidatus Campbellbacteria bacterium CG22_combo_CG10-13_8_21_14_all_36_13]
MIQQNKKIFSSILVFGLLILNIVIFAGFPVSGATKNLKVAFLDIGQGDAIFIESPSGIQMLIDSGQNKSILEELAKIMSYDDRSLDAVLATHPDADHIGGIPFVFERFDVDTYISTTNTSETATYKRVEESVASEYGVVRLNAKRGMFFDMGDGVVVTVLFPDREVGGEDSNDSSIIVKVSYVESDFILTGDAPQSVENYLVGLDGEYLDAEVLKLGHHGSKTSTSESFLEIVSPEYAVISAGRDNRYGHPHKEVVDRVEEKGIQVLNTQIDGTIVFLSDGSRVWVE